MYYMYMQITGKNYIKYMYQMRLEIQVSDEKNNNKTQLLGKFISKPSPII